jgi:hypothetical protein
VYVVASIAKLWSKGQWFTRFGPFEISREAIGDLADQAEFWKDRAVEESDEAGDLRRRLEESDNTISCLLSVMTDEQLAALSDSVDQQEPSLGYDEEDDGKRDEHA